MRRMRQAAFRRMPLSEYKALGGACHDMAAHCRAEEDIRL